MINISIKHNPFTVETVFEINGHPVQSSFAFAEQNCTRRLQLWVEHLFDELYNLSGGNTHFHLEFQGVEADWLDIQEAAKIANEKGMAIQLQWIQAEDPVARIDKIQDLMKEAEKHPDFGENLKKSPKIREMFNEAMNKDFDVYVVATMSSGKSTLINAMLGTDLLPAANQATTATIAQITDNDSKPVGEFVGCRFNKEGDEVDGLQRVTLDTLKVWNAKEDTKLIKLEGNIIGINERENVRLVITDTPGPNSSKDPEHARTTMKHIQDSKRNPLILYILNATQLSTTDDQQVLSKIAEIMQEGGKQSKDRFIFVLNKMDEFDSETGENVEEALRNVTKYLESNGIENPLIYPVSANLTRLYRKREMLGKLTTKENGFLEIMEEVFAKDPTMDLVQYMPLTSSARRNLKEKNLPQVLERSGLPAIESMIDEYIDKYNLPNRVNRAYQALSKALEINENEHNTSVELQEHLDEIENIKETLKELSSNKNKFAEAKVNMEKEIKDKRSLYPSDAIIKIDNEESAIREKINGFQKEFIGSSYNTKISPQVANRKIRLLTNFVELEQSILINSLENMILNSQAITRTKLGKIFDDYVRDLFKNIDIPLPILESLKEQVKDIAMMTNLGLRNDEIEENVRYEQHQTGTKTEYYTVQVERSIINPLRWFGNKYTTEERSREVPVYETKEIREEYVDIDELWDNRVFDVTHHFNELVRSAKEKIISDTEEYANSFKGFMEKEFEVRFKEIISDLQEKTSNKEKIELLAAQSEEKLKRIQAFKQKLDEILAL